MFCDSNPLLKVKHKELIWKLVQIELPRETYIMKFACAPSFVGGPPHRLMRAQCP